MKWLEVAVPLGGKTAVTASEWLWHIVDGQRREVRRLATTDAATRPIQVALTRLYGEIVAGLVADDGLKRRDLFLAERYTAQLFDSWTKATGHDANACVELERTRTFIHLEDADANAFLQWLKEGCVSKAGERGDLAIAATQHLRSAGDFDFALWKAADRKIFEAKVKICRSRFGD